MTRHSKVAPRRGRRGVAFMAEKQALGIGTTGKGQTEVEKGVRNVKEHNTVFLQFLAITADSLNSEQMKGHGGEIEGVDDNKVVMVVGLSV